MDIAAHSILALTALRKKRPLVHNIANYVSMDVAANALLAIGASPAMVHASEEVVEFAALSDALVINIGTLSAFVAPISPRIAVISSSVTGSIRAPVRPASRRIATPSGTRNDPPR